MSKQPGTIALISLLIITAVTLAIGLSMNLLGIDEMRMGFRESKSSETYHVAEWKTDTTYFIKCADEYGNQPNPSQCSVVVRPYDMI